MDLRGGRDDASVVQWSAWRGGTTRSGRVCGPERRQLRAAAAADCWSLLLLGVQPQPVDALSGVADQIPQAGHEAQRTHGFVQLCQQAWSKRGRDV